MLIKAKSVQKYWKFQIRPIPFHDFELYVLSILSLLPVRYRFAPGLLPVSSRFAPGSLLYHRHTAVGLRKTSLLHKQIKNRATLAYKNSVRKCYQGAFFIANMQFNNPTSMPQT